MNRWKSYGKAIVEERTDKFIGLADDAAQADWIVLKHNQDEEIDNRTKGLLENDRRR